MDRSDVAVPHIPQTNGDESLRGEIFSLMVKEADEMTPTEIGDKLDVTRQSVQYHLSALVDAGFVINDGGCYYVQPLFIDSNFEEAFESALADLVPHAEERIYIEDDRDVDPEIIILNNLRLAMTMHLLGES